MGSEYAIASKKKKNQQTSVWNLLSHRYKDVLIGLNGSKSMFTFFSLPSPVTMVPQYTTRPFSGTKKLSKLNSSILH